MADGIFRDSFFFAEVLKYLYLTFDEPDAWSIDEVRYRSFSSASALSDKTLYSTSSTLRHTFSLHPSRWHRTTLQTRRRPTRRHRRLGSRTANVGGAAAPSSLYDLCGHCDWLYVRHHRHVLERRNAHCRDFILCWVGVILIRDFMANLTKLLLRMCDNDVPHPGHLFRYAVDF